MNPPRAKKINVRDLSYLVNEEGRRLKENVFFRSGSLYSFKKKDIRFFERLGLKTVIDLRTPGEIAKKPDPTLPGIEFIHCPIISEATLGISHEKGLKAYKEPPHMPDLYAGIVTSEESLAALGKAIRLIMEKSKDGPVLWHCTAGKDRCGLVSALFLRMLGYKEEDVMDDYLLSDEESEKKGRKYRWLIRHLLRRKQTAEAVYLAMRADRSYLQSAFDAIEKTWGSFSAFVKDHLHIEEEEIHRFLSMNAN